MNGAAAYRAHGADCVVGIGGGAALDVAKVVGVLATHEGDVIEYAWDHPQVRPSATRCRTSSPCRRPRAPAARSAAAASSARTTRTSSASSSRRRSWRKAVFADPELTLGLPPAVTAATGMDALTHNVESYLSPAYHPLCDGIALEGTRIAARALAMAVREPGNLRRARRHDDELDDGRDRVPERPGRGALLRSRARHGLRHAPRPGQRADDRHRARLERRGRAEEVRRARARGRRRAAARRASSPG